MKEILIKIKKDLDKRTDPDRPILTGDMLKFFVLRLLLSVLVYVLINKFILGISILQYVFIDFIFQLGEYFVSILKKK